jgi:phosphoglycerol transferase
MVLFAVALVVLFACDDRPSPTPSRGIVAKTAVQQAVPAYPASLSDGIDFTKPGYPTFVAETQGISGNEPWGRWTDGDKAIIKLQDALPRAFYLELIVRWAFGPNANVPVKIRVGAAEQSFTVTQENEIFRFEFLIDQNVNTIEIIPPKPTSPKSMKMNKDERLLGVGLVKLRIIQK